jgi:translation initiation factor 2 subunit 3
MIQIMNNQPIINIGIVGSVADGKSTCVEKLTGTKTQRHSSEQNRNITIKQGYANMKIWKDSDNEFFTTNSNHKKFDNQQGDKCELVNHISFVDCPGHHELIQTTMASTSIMDGAIIVIAVNEPLNFITETNQAKQFDGVIKKPQLIQHLGAIKLAKIDKIIVCLNKIDLIDKLTLLNRVKEIYEILNYYDIKPYAIIPTSFNKRIGISYLIKAIMGLFNPSSYSERINNFPIFRISRTFDINKPGTNWEQVKGGVIGGTLISGKLKVGDQIEIRPGQVSKNKDTNKFVCQPIKTTILSIKSETSDLNEIIPGGLIGIGTDLDPFYCKNDMLIGNIMGKIDQLPNIYDSIRIKINLIKMFGAKWKPKINDIIILQMSNRITEAQLINIDKYYHFSLKKPSAIQDNQHIVICKEVDKILKIVGEAFFSKDKQN